MRYYNAEYTAQVSVKQRKKLNDLVQYRQPRRYSKHLTQD